MVCTLGCSCNVGLLECAVSVCVYVCKQQQYNLLYRDSEMDAFQVCKIEGVGVLPWSPLKGYVYAQILSQAEVSK